MTLQLLKPFIIVFSHHLPKLTHVQTNFGNHIFPRHNAIFQIVVTIVYPVHLQLVLVEQIQGDVKKQLGLSKVNSGEIFYFEVSLSKSLEELRMVEMEVHQV